MLILHHNVQNLKNKLLELTVLLQTDLKNVDILCFIKHWLKEDQFGLINIESFKLVSNFSRIRNEHGGSCIYVKEYLQTKELNYLQKLGKEKVFKMSVAELLNYKVVVCIYRSPGGDFHRFLKNLENIILYGDWSNNFLEDSLTLQELKYLLRLYNLANIVASPTRITKNSLTLIDVFVTNRQVFECSSSVLDLGYLDHLAQILNINANRPDRGPQMSRKTVY
jgi:exonuclease III